MLLRLDDRDTAPLHEKIAAGLRRALAAGDLGVGERLPSARELGSSLGVNMHTVLRAYAQLADEGLVSMRRGRGVTVLAAGPDRAELHHRIRALVDEARRLGIEHEELVVMIEEAR
ncbi:DNA-binding transcriptional regulator YhcF, GntR family [Amycolatopsis pretoriensis]|uniref:DNA-binding transcriptional regulator YhcF, GntR family n=1 Tax=Amycolatopsis pretoriensis TaxID=218821 RepID=A0A1H5QEC4_9PSEU|nr:GntR family transcriptional regulator [Amycolatopsis pretoriensis]SEF23741.1 DNA-binding transcriptional regulator YhcF, GntR family [Amycolatopsis pretoriensis]